MASFSGHIVLFFYVIASVTDVLPSVIWLWFWMLYHLLAFRHRFWLFEIVFCHSYIVWELHNRFSVISDIVLYISDTLCLVVVVYLCLFTFSFFEVSLKFLVLFFFFIIIIIFFFIYDKIETGCSI